MINRTIHGLHDALGTLNGICTDIVEKGANYERLRDLEHSIASVNSYLGFTVHCDAYNVRLEAFARMGPAFKHVCFIKGGAMACVKIRRKYKVKVYLYEQEKEEYGMVLR